MALTAATNPIRAVLAVVGLAVILAAAVPAYAAMSKTGAQRVLTSALVHKYGVGTRPTTLCKPLRGKFRCAYIAALRTGRVYMGNANVDRRRHVQWLKTHCVGERCPRKRN